MKSVPSVKIRLEKIVRLLWLLALIFGLRQFVVHGIVVHQIPFLVGLGVSPELAATMLGSIAVISIVGRLGLGRLADVFDKKYVMVICLSLVAIGSFILANAQDLWHVILFLIIYSPAYGGGMVVMNAIRADYFGRKYFGTIRGFMNAVQMFGTVLGPLFAGWIYDVTGNYDVAFFTFTIAAAVATLLMLIVQRPQPIPHR